jgi:hypothetical protein
MKQETFKAQNIDEMVWLRLNRLRSVKLCENLIRQKLRKAPNDSITEEIIKSKAIGLSSAIESAIGYWQVTPQSINAKVLSRYYFLLQMTIAEQVSSVKNTDELKTVQKHTESGHGLGTIFDSTADFPDSCFTFAIQGGHFYSYAKSLGIDIKTFSFDKRPRDFSKISEPLKLVSLMDLFRRIPELTNIIEEYTGQPPLSFNIGHSDLNMVNDLDDAKRYMDRTGEFVLKVPPSSSEKNTFVSIYSESEKVTVEFLDSLALPLKNFTLVSGLGIDESYITGEMTHPSDKYWHQVLETYSSSYSPTSIIVPLWNSTSDIVVINITLLYTLSIIVRYMPDIWYRISSGDLDHIGSLIEHYISIVDHTIPLQMLEKITDTEIVIHQPGSIFGPI